MPTSGRFLENLVTFVERKLAPQGAVVKSPERFYAQGTQIGEIDITIRGQFGSSSVFIGLECRDRPKDGPQGAPWITELAGKKATLGVDKMVAVSSTGFVPGAAIVAKQHGIDLLTLETVTEEEVDHFLHLAHFAVCVQHYELCGVTCVGPAEHKDLLTEVGDAEVLNGPKEGIRFSPFIHGLVPVAMETWDTRLENDLVLKGNDFCITRQEPLHVRLRGQEFSLNDLELKLKVWRQVQRGKVVLTRLDRAISGDIATYVGVAKTRFESRDLHVFFTIDKVDKNSASTCHVQLVDSSGRPFFPPGTPVEVRLFAPDFSWGPKYWSAGITVIDERQRVSIALHLPNVS